VSFVSSLPANLPKHGVLPTWDSAVGHERYVRITYSPDYAVGVEEYNRTLSEIDFATGLETVIVLLPQHDRAFVSERLRRMIVARDLSRTVETFLIRQFGTDSSRGKELGYVPLAPKYLDLQTGKITTTPTQQSVLIGVGGVSGCVAVGDVTLCYKKLDDTLDWETLLNLLTAFKLIDDRVGAWLDLVNKRMPNIINKILFELL